MKLFFIIASSILSLSALAESQYKVVPCKDAQYKGETCLAMATNSVEKFFESDVAKIRELAKLNPTAPWMEIIDHDGTLISTMATVGLPKKTPKADADRFKELIVIAQLSKKTDPDLALEIIGLFLKSNPKENFHFNNPVAKKFEPFEGILFGEAKAKTGVRSYCDSFDQDRYRQVMDQRNLCMSNVDMNNNAEMVYRVLAEVIACEKYCITAVGVTETARMRSIGKASCAIKTPCAIQFEKVERGEGSAAGTNVSMAIGLGALKFTMNGKQVEASWNSKYDLFGKRNTDDFWRNQIFPQVEELYSGKPAVKPAESADPIDDSAPARQ